VNYVWVGVAGALGAVTRYAIGLAIGPERFPWVTLAINVTGSFALTFLITFAAERYLSTSLVTAIAVGFLGAYTTFSTFSHETFVLAHTGRGGTAAIYVVVSVLGGLAAAWGGYELARAVR
jgi:CrcB protein